MKRISIFTFNQIIYHIEHGETVAFATKQFDGFIEKENDNYLFTAVSKDTDKGRGKTYSTKRKQDLQDMFETLTNTGVRMFVIPGARLIVENGE